MLRNLYRMMGCRWTLTLGALCCFLALAQGQQDSLLAQQPAQVAVPDSVASDSTAKQKATFFRLRRTPPNPKTSLRLSLILPGAGQIYNGRWWKTPFVYGALGGMIYLIDYNQDLYRRLKTALELQVQDKPHEFTGRINSANALRSLRDQYDKNTQLSYIGLVAVYGVIAIEAFTDAHLQNFDISEDLSFKVKPTFITPPLSSPVPAIGFVFTY